MPPAASIAAAAAMTAMMISIALTGGSPGSSPKTKTRMSVPTPPQRPSPMPPVRTPRAMKAMTTRPSIAMRIQSLVLVDVSPVCLAELLARARGRGRARASQSSSGSAVSLTEPSARRLSGRWPSTAAVSASDRPPTRRAPPRCVSALVVERVLLPARGRSRRRSPSREASPAACSPLARVGNARPRRSPRPACRSALIARSIAPRDRRPLDGVADSAVVLGARRSCSGRARPESPPAAPPRRRPSRRRRRAHSAARDRLAAVVAVRRSPPDDAQHQHEPDDDDDQPRSQRIIGSLRHRHLVDEARRAASRSAPRSGYSHARRANAGLDLRPERDHVEPGDLVADHGGLETGVHRRSRSAARRTGARRRLARPRAPANRGSGRQPP